ncbi:Lipase (class 3) [Ceratobasidium sp. AG-Ba]|nr:Lipase (class 3) [Ceratobasidium sp. AG-Ba]
MTSYNVFQQVFKLSFASNLVRKVEDPAPELEKELAGALADISPEWTVSWGPVVWKEFTRNPVAVQGNAWFVAYNQSLRFDDGQSYPTYVVAIAGTTGVYDVAKEDAACGQVVDIDDWAVPGLTCIQSAPQPIQNTASLSSETAYISNGFAQALFHILNATPQGSTQSLPDFLQSALKSQSDAKIVITGHGLGGALAPLLAYVLAKTETVPQANMYAYPTAGPSPGNMAFVNNFGRIFPSNPGKLTGYQNWNVNVVNPLDIVPCAYCTDPEHNTLVLQSIPTMYGNPSLGIVNTAVEHLEKLAGRLYYPLKYATIDSPVPVPSPAPGDFKEWRQIALSQHIDAYKEVILGNSTPEEQDMNQEDTMALAVPGVLGCRWKELGMSPSSIRRH